MLSLKIDNIEKSIKTSKTLESIHLHQSEERSAITDSIRPAWEGQIRSLRMNRAQGLCLITLIPMNEIQKRLQSTNEETTKHEVLNPE